MRGFSGLSQLCRRFPGVASTAKAARQVRCAETSLFYQNRLQTSSLCCRVYFILDLQHLSTCAQPGITWEGSSSTAVLRNLETALRDDCLDEAWEAFQNCRKLLGFPNHQLVSKLIILLSYSSNPEWLCKAYNLVLMILDEKPHLLHYDPLTRLALALGRSQKPIFASTIMRIMLERGNFPPVDILCTVFFHLVRTQIGSYLACDILLEICESFLHGGSDPRKNKQKELIKPNLTVFNLVLSSCMKYKSNSKAQKIIEFMPMVGVIADANSIVIIARIYDMIGERDALMKLKRHIDGISSSLLSSHYQQFYDCLMSLHFKYNDIDAAAELFLDLYRRSMFVKSCNELSGTKNHLQKHCLIQIGSSNLKMGSEIMSEPEQLKSNFVVEVKSHSGLVLFTNGKLLPSNKALSKLILGFMRGKNVVKLSNLLVSLQKEVDLEESNVASEVIAACVQLGWLETAHDILDDMEKAAFSMGSNAYALLLKAYLRKDMFKESKVLLKQMRKIGLCVNLSYENAMSFCLSQDGLLSDDARTMTLVGSLQLAEALERESRFENASVQSVYDFNSSIHFFCKAKMIEDAERTYKRMHQRNVNPTVQTFNHLVNGYSSLDMYREITILWGEIRRRIEDGVLVADRDLFECLLWNFLRGGYFARVMEIVNHMTKNKMYIDKWKYKREFLKFHKDLYRNLKAADARTDAQSNRIEHVQAFRRWVGINQKS